MEETGVPEENHRPEASRWQILSCANTLQCLNHPEWNSCSYRLYKLGILSGFWTDGQTDRKWVARFVNKFDDTG
jgi:hypothetical protein